MSRDDWPDIRAHITTEFAGEQPGPHLEEELIQIYEAKPQAILTQLPSIAQSLRDGKINSGWAVLRTAAAKAALAKTTSGAIGREKLLRNVDQWLKNAGLHYTSWHEVEDELFGDQGRLKTIDTPALRTRYLEQWQAIRPAGIQLDADELERAHKWKADEALRSTIPKVPSPDNVKAFLARQAEGAPT
jgi:hypothetical protein